MSLFSNIFRYKPSFDRSVFGQLTNDWYCCECHSCKAEELLTNCKTCFRAFHMNCIKEWTIDENNIECNYCLKLQQLDKSLRINCIERQFLNKLLKLLLKCLEEFMNFDICKYFSFSEDNKKAKVLLFKDMDLKIIDYKTKIYSYFSVQQFENDFKHFVHNYIVLNPENSMTEYKRLMKIKKHFNKELSELKLCVDCYNYSNNDEFKGGDDQYEWFTHVCDPPHRLVDAKLKNHPFWPSKVITVSDDQQKYDVRFFDPPMFKRAIIPLHRLRPIQDKSKKKRLKKPIEILKKHCEKLREKGFNV